MGGEYTGVVTLLLIIYITEVIWCGAVGGEYLGVVTLLLIVYITVVI